MAGMAQECEAAIGSECLFLFGLDGMEFGLWKISAVDQMNNEDNGAFKDGEMEDISNRKSENIGQGTMGLILCFLDMAQTYLFLLDVYRI
ncbi:hypothetical protein STEG23_018434 [Scotinomys teguina]